MGGDHRPKQLVSIRRPVPLGVVAEVRAGEGVEPFVLGQRQVKALRRQVQRLRTVRQVGRHGVVQVRVRPQVLQLVETYRDRPRVEFDWSLDKNLLLCSYQERSGSPEDFFV